jgi:hypothetical protein
MCTHLMCLDRSLELLNEYKHCGHLFLSTFLCTHLMCLDRSLESLNKYNQWSHLLFLTLLCTHLIEIDGIMKNIKFHISIAFGATEKKRSAKLKRSVHPKQQSGSRSRKKPRPNFGRDSGMIKTSVLVSVSGSRRNGVKWVTTVLAWLE